MLSNIRTDLELPCTLRWGTDPRIELTGRAIEIGAETLSVVLDDSDCRLWPEPGRRVQVFVEWLAAGQSSPKYFMCRGTVEVAVALESGAIRLSCRIRTGRFIDSAAKPKARQQTAPGNGWTM